MLILLFLFIIVRIKKKYFPSEPKWKKKYKKNLKYLKEES